MRLSRQALAGGSVTPRSLFIGVFSSVTLLVFLVIAAASFIAPRVYMSEARVAIESDPLGKPAYLDLIQSQLILQRVVDRLNFKERYARHDGTGKPPMSDSDAIAELKNTLEFELVPGHDLINIKAFSTKRDDAAEVANTVAEAYQDYCYEQRRIKNASRNVNPLELVHYPQFIVDMAEPSMNSVRPKQSLHLLLGGLLGIGLGLAAGAVRVGIYASGKG